MRVLVTGANGFIGSRIVQGLIANGHDVTACVRDVTGAQHTLPAQHIMAVDFTLDHHVDDWISRLKEIDVVINTVGIVTEKGSQTFAALHTKAPCALFKACTKTGVKKVIQISALGTDQGSLSRYHQSKRQADKYLMGLDIEWAILMPSIVIGPGAKSTALFKAMSALPVIPLLDAGEQKIQPLYIDDLVAVVMRLVEQAHPKKIKIDVVGPEAITLKELYTLLRKWLEKGEARFITQPVWLSTCEAKLAGYISSSYLTVETLEMLRGGNIGNSKRFIEQFGFSPENIKASLTRTPVQQADKWHAELYFMLPILRLSIVFLWLVTGILSAGIYPVEKSYQLLASVGITGPVAPIALYGAALLDVLLGLATLYQYRLKQILPLQILVIVIYTVIISFHLPEYWLHPFGPLTKNIPLLVAILILSKLERCR